MEKNQAPIVNLKSKERGKWDTAFARLVPGIMVKMWADPHLCGRNPKTEPGEVLVATFINMEYLPFHHGVEFQRDYLGSGPSGSLENFPLLYCWHGAEVKGFLYSFYIQHGRQVNLIQIAPFAAIANARSAGLIVGPRTDWR